MSQISELDGARRAGGPHPPDSHRHARVCSHVWQAWILNRSCGIWTPLYSNRRAVPTGGRSDKARRRRRAANLSDGNQIARRRSNGPPFSLRMRSALARTPFPHRLTHLDALSAVRIRLCAAFRRFHQSLKEKRINDREGGGWAIHEAHLQSEHFFVQKSGDIVSIFACHFDHVDRLNFQLAVDILVKALNDHVCEPYAFDKSTS